MLRVVLRPDYATLAAALAARLNEPMVGADPFELAMTPEWIVTPSVGTRQWLRHELSHVVGASNAERRDGVVANWHHEFPGALTNRLLAPHLEETFGRQRDPWAMPELTFRLLELAQREHDQPHVRPLQSGEGEVLLSRARHFADLFDRYHLWRHDLVATWANGGVLDPSDPREAEQAHLWRALRREIDVPSPPERWGDALTRAAAQDVPRRDRWPNARRLSVFGLTAFPGGLRFLDTIGVLAQHLDVAMYLVHGFDDEVLTGVHDRMDFHSELMQMWGGLPLANAPIIEELMRRADHIDREVPHSSLPTNFLTSLQNTLRRDEVVPVAHDNASIVEHWCHGPMRQAEVLRDAIRHDLNSSRWEPALDESEILVVCSDIEQYAPLIRTAFGAPRSEATEDQQPALAYRIIDPRLISEGPYLRSIRQGLELVRSRCSRSDVLSFLEAPPVAARRRLGTDDLEIVSSWTKEAGVRWGLNAQHREAFGVSGLGDVNTWRAGLDRVLLGIAVENPSFRSVRDVLPVEVLAGRIDLVGNLIEIVELLEGATHTVRQPQTLANWLEWFDEFVAALIVAGPDEESEASRVSRAIAEIREVAEAVTVAVSYGDFLAILEEAWSGVGSVSHLLTGGITVTSVDTLRWIPFRSVYLVGFDDEAFTRPDWSIDDLRRRQLEPGDITPNDDARSRLSELILSAKERFTLLRTYRDITNNTEVDFGIAYAEYRQAVVALAGSAHPLKVEHPRHGFSRENFDPGAAEFASARAANLLTGSWSLSQLDHKIVVGSSVVAETPNAEIAVPLVPASEYSLSELANFLRDPVSTHLRIALGIRDESLSIDENDDLDIGISARQRPQFLRRLFQFGQRENGDLDSARRALLRSGDIPPEEFAPGARLVEETNSFIEHFSEVTYNATEQQLSVEIPVGKFVIRDDVRVHLFEGEVTVAHIVTSEVRARHVFQPWLEVLAVRAVTPPEVPVILEIMCLKDGVVSTITCPVSLNPDEAVGVLVDVVKLYLLNLQKPIPFDSDIDIHEEWNELEEEEWQGEKLNRTHCYLGKPSWRLIFGDFTVDDILDYAPSPGYDIENVRGSIRWFLSHGIDLAGQLVKKKK